MKSSIILIALLTILFASCNHSHDTEKHDEHKIQLTAYSNEFEVFAEADAFVKGKTSNILSHFSHLSSFKPLDSGSVTIHLTVNGKETTQTLETPLRKGIYSFDIKPETTGSGQILYDITTPNGNFKVVVPKVMVYETEAEADKAAKIAEVSKTNTTVFTKEQSWKIDFSTGLPIKEPFGQIIKTTAQVQSSQGDEIVVAAKSSGIVMLTANNVLEGKTVTKGQVLFTISGNDFAENNSNVRFLEAKNNFEKAKADFERVQELAKDKIVSGKDLNASKNQYDNAKAIFDNLNKNFNASGQKVYSPIAGFIKQLFIHNGSYVEAGQPIAAVSQNKVLMLSAEVQQKYAHLLGTVISANIRTPNDNHTYSFEELNGKILSYGKNTNSDNYLIPVNLQIDNKGDFVPGSFVEIFLKTLSDTSGVTVPNTAIMEEQGIYAVYVQITPELFEKREVKIGGTDGFKTEILNGITHNDRIVNKGAILIKLSQSTGTLDAHSGHVH